MDFRVLQNEVSQWSYNNFGDQPAINPFLGVVEEVGELSHALLKHNQGIRGVDDKKLVEMKIDAVADIIIFLADFCGRNGIDMQDAVDLTWKQVKQRNWKGEKGRNENNENA